MYLRTKSSMYVTSERTRDWFEIGAERVGDFSYGTTVSRLYGLRASRHGNPASRVSSSLGAYTRTRSYTSNDISRGWAWCGGWSSRGPRYARRGAFLHIVQQNQCR